MRNDPVCSQCAASPGIPKHAFQWSRAGNQVWWEEQTQHKLLWSPHRAELLEVVCHCHMPRRGFLPKLWSPRNDEAGPGQLLSFPVIRRYRHVQRGCSSWPVFRQESSSKPAFVGTEFRTDALEPALKLLEPRLAIMAPACSSLEPRCFCALLSLIYSPSPEKPLFHSRAGWHR